jgi:hypothetical protein
LARLEGVPEDSSLFARGVYAVTRRKVGRMVEPVSVAAHHPRLLPVPFRADAVAH